MSASEIDEIRAKLTAITTSLERLRNSHKMDTALQTGQLNRDWLALRQKLDQLQQAIR